MTVFEIKLFATVMSPKLDKIGTGRGFLFAEQESHCSQDL